MGKSAGYHPDVFDDEVHAYLTADPSRLEIKGGIDIEPLMPYHYEFQSVFDAYRNKN